MVKQLEGLFAELSATVYGLPLLVWRIGRSPVRGSLRLYVRHRLKRDAHIGPHTAVLLTGFLLSVWTGQNDRVRQFAGGLIAGRGLTEPIVISVLLAAFIDAGGRLFGRLRYARDVRRRPRAVAMLLYTAAFAIATIGPFFWLALLTSTTIVNAGLLRGMLAGVLFLMLLYAAACAASWPSMAVYAALRRRSIRHTQAPSVFPFAFLGIFMAADVVGGGLVRWIQTPPVRLSSPYTACTVDDATVGVVAVLQNNTTDVMIVDSRNLAVRLSSGESGGLSQLPVEVTRSSLASAGGLITIPPDAVALVEATANPRHPDRRGTDLGAETRPQRCELVKKDERRPLWLGERGGGSFALFPSLAPLEPWPDASQENLVGTGTVIDRRRASEIGVAPARSP